MSLRLAVARGLPCEVDTASYFLSHISIRPERGGGMAMWRKKLFVAMGRNAASPVEYFRLPEDSVISLTSTHQAVSLADEIRATIELAGKTATGIRVPPDRECGGLRHAAR